ncbi:hypothetical protein COI44_01745 [Bacillus sp. AFS088145]|nr:hypothetical protein COI44_01745 [Bacillus sp. AFS088145]
MKFMLKVMQSMKKRTRSLNVGTSTCIFASAFLVLNSQFTIDPNIGRAQETNPDDAMTRVIVEMEDTPAIQIMQKSDQIGSLSRTTERKLKDQIENLKQSHGKVLDEIKEKMIPFKKTNDYTFTFNGVSLQVPKSKVNDLRLLPGVKAVYQDQQYHSDLTNSVPLIGAPDVWSKHDQNNQEVTGKGVTVAVIDTGVDYDHPDLGGAFGPGHKVVGGYDFVNNDNDPMDDYGHGTHVAGIIAAHGKLTGVAPDASITAYKVLDNNGSGTTSNIIAGIEAAISPDNPFPADVINMSLSGPGDGNDPISQAAQNAVDAGVVVVAAAGNAGPDYGTIGAPAMAEGVLAVGASVSGIKVPDAKIVAPIDENLSVTRLGFTANPPETAITSDLIDVGNGGVENYNGVDVKGKIVLIQLPLGSDGRTEAITAQDKGAAAAIFFEPVQVGPVFKLGDTLPSQYTFNSYEELQTQHQFMIGSTDDGQLESLVSMKIDGTKAGELKSYLAKGPVKITISGKDITDKIANFSSRGNSELQAKPDLVAPGVEINSTYIKTDSNDSGYTRLSGTSMAAPHVAGAAALMKQLKPSWNASEISGALKETAKPLASYDVLTQGTGRLDVKAAAETNVIASPNVLNLGLADLKDSEINRNASLTLNNPGDVPVDMDFSIKEDTKSGAKVTVNPSHIHINPGQQVNVGLNINLKRPDQDANISGWVEGNIQSAKGSQHIRVPYKLIARHFKITASPDPVGSTVEDTTAYIYSPVNLTQAPKVTVYTPSRKTIEVEAVLDHDRWWKANVPTNEVGIYRIDASTIVKNSTNDNSTIIGSSFLEKLPKENENASTWNSIGPYSNAGLMNIDLKNSKNMTVLPSSTLSLFHTEDRAETWHEYRNFPVAGGVATNLVVDPTDEKNIYVAINSKYNDLTYTGKIVASKDGGKSWKTLSFPDIEISDLEIDNSGQKLIATSRNEVYVSTDRGLNWVQLPGWWGFLTKAKLLNNDLYISAGYQGLYVFKDVFSGSATSELLYQPPFPYRSTKEIVGDDDFLVTSTFGGGLYASYNKGKDWKELTHSDLPFNNVSRLEIIEGDIYVGTAYDGILVSHDKGKTWETWKKPLPGYNSFEIDFALGGKSSPKGNRPIYVSSDQAGIYGTLDKGESYKRIGIPAATVYDLAISRSSKGYQLIAATDSNTYMTALPLQNKIDSEWGAAEGEGRFGEQVFKIATSPTESNVVYKIRYSAIGTMNVYQSKDGGEKWDQKFVDSGLPTAMLINPADSKQIVISYTIPGTNELGIYISKDAGETWKKIKQEHKFTALTSADSHDPNRIWAGGNDGLFLSKDMGQTFEKIQNVPISSIAIDSHNPSHLILGGNHLYISSDGGKTLEMAKGAGTAELNMYVNDIIVSPTHHNIVYAASGSFYESGLLKGGRGVLKSMDGGKTWTNLSKDLENRNAITLQLSPDEEYLFVGTQGGSVQRLKLPKHQQ